MTTRTKLTQPARAWAAMNALQGLPDPTLRTLAASSLGLGAGVYLTGAPGLMVVAGLIPAILLSVAIALRPVGRLVPNGVAR